MTHRPWAPWLSFTMTWGFFFLAGYVAFLDGDGDGEGDETLSRLEADSWVGLAAEDDDDLHSFVSFDLPSLRFLQGFALSAPSLMSLIMEHLKQ